MKARRLLSTALFSCLLAVCAFGATAQPYPTKPLRLICPYPPGGTTDVVARAIANELGKVLGQTVVVDNRAGAGGNLGAEAAARSAPDGYTLLISGSSLHGITPVLYRRLAYDPNKDLAPVIALAFTNNVLVVHPSVKANSVRELIDLAKAQPGRLTYASTGSGTTVHLSGEMFKSMAQVDIVHVPYKGSAPAATDLLGGQVSMMFDSVPSALPHIKAGKVRALATTGMQRDPALPDVPTMREAGLPGYQSGVWVGLVVPAGTPGVIVDRLNAAAQKAIASPGFRRQMTDVGYQILGGTPRRMADLIQDEIRTWTPIVKASGATID